MEAGLRAVFITEGEASFVAACQSLLHKGVELPPAATDLFAHIEAASMRGGGAKPAIAVMSRHREKYFMDFTLDDALIFDPSQRVNIALFLLNLLHLHVGDNADYGILHEELIGSLREAVNPSVRCYHTLLLAMRNALLHRQALTAEAFRSLRGCVSALDYYDADILCFLLYVIQEAPPLGDARIWVEARALRGEVHDIVRAQGAGQGKSWALLELVCRGLDWKELPPPARRGGLRHLDLSTVAERLQEKQCLPFTCLKTLLDDMLVADGSVTEDAPTGPMISVRWHIECVLIKAQSWARNESRHRCERRIASAALDAFSAERRLCISDKGDDRCLALANSLLLCALQGKGPVVLQEVATDLQNNLQAHGSTWPAAIVGQLAKAWSAPACAPARHLSDFLVDSRLLVQALRHCATEAEAARLLRRLNAMAVLKHASLAGNREARRALALHFACYLCLLLPESV